MLQLILSGKKRVSKLVSDTFKKIRYLKGSAKLKNRLAIVWEAKKTP